MESASKPVPRNLTRGAKALEQSTGPTPVRGQAVVQAGDQQEADDLQRAIAMSRPAAGATAQRTVSYDGR